MQKTMTDGRIKGLVVAMIQGQRLALYGKAIECMRPKKLYKLADVPSLLTAAEAANKVLEAKAAMPRLEKLDIPSEPIFPDTLRAMSVHAPWAYLIVHGYKTEEYRSRNVNFRGLFLTHASQSKASDWVIDEYNLPRAEVEAMRGCIVGAAKITGTHHISPEDGWAHEIGNEIAFPKIVPNVSGQQSQFWKASTPERVKAFNHAWMKLEEMEYDL